MSSESSSAFPASTSPLTPETAGDVGCPTRLLCEENRWKGDRACRTAHPGSPPTRWRPRADLGRAHGRRRRRRRRGMARRGGRRRTPRSHRANRAPDLPRPTLSRDRDILSDLVLPLVGSIAQSESLLVAFGDVPSALMAEAAPGTAPSPEGKDVANHRGDDPRRSGAPLPRRQERCRTGVGRCARRASRGSPSACARPTSPVTTARTRSRTR